MKQSNEKKYTMTKNSLDGVMQDFEDVLQKQEIKRSNIKAKKFDGMGDDKNVMKLRWDLVPYEALEKIVETYTYGTARYSEEIVGFNNIIKYLNEEVNSWIKDSAKIIQIEKLDAKVFVDLVMKSNLENQIQRMQKGNVKINENGLKKILKSIKLYVKDEDKIQKNGNEIKEQKELEFYENEGLRKIQPKIYWNIKRTDVRSVKENLQNTQSVLITITQQDLLEDIYVIAATQESECLEILLKVLKEHLDILKNIQLKNSQTIWISGDNNWQGIEPHRYFAALMRHIVAWKNGEVYDPESGLLHMAHAGFNVLALIYFDLKQEVKKNNDKD